MTPHSPSPSRRQFLRRSALTAGTLAAAGALPVHAAGGDTLRVGLIGCGGRGTGAAEQAVSADSNVKLVAMADAFGDRIEGSLRTLQRRLGNAYTDKVDVAPEH